MDNKTVCLFCDGGKPSKYALKFFLTFEPLIRHYHSEARYALIHMQICTGETAKFVN